MSLYILLVRNTNTKLVAEVENRTHHTFRMRYERTQRPLACLCYKMVVPVGLEPTMFIFPVKSRNQSPLWGRHHKFFKQDVNSLITI